MTNVDQQMFVKMVCVTIHAHKKIVRMLQSVYMEIAFNSLENVTCRRIVRMARNAPIAIALIVV